MNAITTGSNANGQPGLRDVEAAVRSVLAGILRDGVTTGHVITSAKRAIVTDVYRGRLFGLKHAEAVESGVRQIRVAPGTVVTPLAKDLLKRAGVEIQWASQVESDAVKKAGEWGFSVDDSVRSGSVEAFRRSLLTGEEAWRELSGSLNAACNWVAEAVSRGVVMLAAEASTAVYLACRKPGIRAASAAEPDAVARAVRALGVNLLVVEPAGRSIATLKQICTTFRRAGGPVGPEWVERDVRGGGMS
jgi:hypothetical protein